MDYRDKRIYVAGSGGMVGSALIRSLGAYDYRTVITRSSNELNLIDQAAVRDFFNVERPEVVILTAAKVGGILANDRLRAEFLYVNLMIEANVIDAAYRAGVQKLIFLGSSCIYPRLTLAAGVSAPTAGRLNHVAIPGLVILFWLVRRLPYSNRIAPAALLFLCLLGASYAVQRQMVEKKYLDMPAGRSAFLSPETFDRYNWIAENTQAGDSLFEAHHPSFYFPFHLKNPTPMSIMRDSEYTPRFQVDATVEALEKELPDLIVWDGMWSKPAESRAAGDNLAPLWQFIESNYDLEMEYPPSGDYSGYSARDIEIWRRKGARQKNSR